MSFKRSFCVTLCACATFMLTGSSNAQTPIRIMPLGDSITYGSSNPSAPGGYRLPLYVALTNAGYNVDYVGSQTGNSAAGLGTEVNHEGHGGWRVSHDTIGLYENLYSWFDLIEDPHVVLIHAGTNDTNDPDFEHCIDEMDALITRIAACQPSAKIIVTSIMKRGSPTDSRYIAITNYFNPYVYPLVTNHVAQGHDVHYLDMHAYLELDDMNDNLHPNETGYAKMAAAWFPAITNIIGTNVSANLPAPMRIISSQNNLNTLSISFNKTLSLASATNTANYVMDGGVTVTNATLSANQRSVTLTTTLQSPATLYTLTINDVEDQTTPTALPVPADSQLQFTTTSAPTPLSVQGGNDLTHVVILFNKELSTASATDTANYAIDSGITVTAAVLSSDKKTVTLTTSAQTAETLYTVTMNNIEDLTTPTPLTIPVDSEFSFTARTPRGYANNVAESSAYTLVYSMDLPNTAAYETQPVPYAVDNTAMIGPFSRVAYYLELRKPDGALQYLWVSMDAFTNNVEKLGLPTFSSGVVFQQNVDNMNVFCNVAGVTTGTGLTTGNLEFWPWNYSGTNAKMIPNASGSTYDFGDQCSYNGNYGCMQIHNHGASQVLFAINHWNTGGALQIGIGNNPSTNPDWTTSDNGSQYSIKSLQVLVLCDPSGDTTPPAPVSALAGVTGYGVTIKFDELLSVSSADSSCFALDYGVQILSATLLDDLKTITLMTTRQPIGQNLTLAINGVRDLAGNPVPAETTIALTALPTEITTNAGSLADAYELIYTLDIPAKGNFNSTSDFYRYDQSALAPDFDRIAYYMELEKTDGSIQYLWTSMDAFTDDTSKIAVPVAARGTVWQQSVNNLDVKSNVAGISNGVSMAGGNLEFWASNYSGSNTAGVPGASGTAFDFGDSGGTATAGHGCMQVHNHLAAQTLFALNNWGVDNQSIAVGIGNRSSGEPDWTHAANAWEYKRRTLHILVRPQVSLPALPPAVEANVPQALGYQLAYTINLPVNGSFNNNSPAYYSVNNVTNGVISDFSRIAYYLEVVPNSTTTTQYIWTAMDAFTTDARKIGVPTNSCFFQQKVAHLEVRSNVGGIITGSDIDTGNIEFWPSSYNQSNTLSIPNASTTAFDFGDGNANGTTTGYGSMQVHNYGTGATQTLFAVNNFNNNAALCVGIGNNSGPDGYLDWTHSYSASDYSYRRLHVFVLPGTVTGDTTRPTMIRAAASLSLNQISIQFSETLNDAAATPSFFSINNGIAILDTQLMPDRKVVVLTTSALTAGQSYTVTVTGVRDSSINNNAILPYSTVACTAPAYSWPDVLTNVTEAADYQLIHQLAIGNNTSYANGCNYSIDQSYISPTQSFDRIAYCMELENAGTGYHWVYVSMDAFTADLSKIGVPTADRGNIWQQYVSNMNVYASANVANSSVTTGVGITAGNLEFWASNYSTGNVKAIPGASASAYDFGDDIGSNTGAGYGSMQVHNYSAGHTIFAMNNFGGNNREPALGIGNCPAPINSGVDWTFNPNASSHTIKNIYVLTRPGTPADSGTPPAIWGQPRSQTIYQEESARLTVYAPQATGFQWRKNSIWLQGETESWLDISDADSDDSGTYDVIVTGTSGTALSASAELHVYPYTQPEPPKAIRIMPLGDSITYGSNTAGGYRLPLYTALTGAGYVVDYVGTQTSNPSGSLPDSDHEGHSGWTISGLNDNILNWFAAIDDPDVILLHIGTNDSGATDFSNRVDRLDDFVTKMTVARPNANIIVTTLLKRSDATRYANITNLFNPYVEGKVLGQQALGHKVHYLDMHAYLELTDMYDGLHPNAGGYQKMADAWFSSITNVVSPYGDSSAPALNRAVALDGLESVQVDFSKALDPETATNSANYALSDGASIASATLSEDQRTVTLITSPLTHNLTYTLTVNHVMDYSWPISQAIEADSTATFQATVRGYLANVPESADYRLVYAIDLPSSAAYGSTLVSYSTDNTAQFNCPLDRIAYYLELQKAGEGLTYLWVSMDAFTDDATQIGIPTKLSGAVYQQYVNNMTIACNDPSITTGNGITGNIEFWPTDYGASNDNGIGITGASNSQYDFGDERRTTGSHGSMQVHNPGAGQTLFAFNNWGSSGGSTPGIGIGNCPAPINNGLDWTFTSNAGTYTIRALYVLATPAIDSTPPTLVSAQAGSAGTLVSVTLSEAIDADSVSGQRFTIDQGVKVIAATLLPDLKTVQLITTAQPAGTTLTLSVTGVRDAGGGNPIAPASTIIIAAAALPAGITANAGALADDFELVYTIDIPVTGSFNSSTDAYIFDQSNATGSFDRIAYYLELVTGSGSTQYVWTAMDAFTQYRKQIGVPTASNKAIFQQTVSNLDVKSNVSGVDNGSGLSTGNIEFWPNSYSAANAIGIPNASSSALDFGDTITGTTPSAGYGSMQVHNYGTSKTVFALNNFGSDGNAICVGIGQQSTGNPDWTHAYNAGTFARRTLHVMVRPAAPAPAADLPAEIAANIASAANGYQLVCSITNIPVNSSFNSSSAAYIIDKRTKVAAGSFNRIAYYLELETATSNQWVWTAMDTFTADPAKIGIPVSGTLFQQKVTNLDVLSNDGNISTGTGITTGNIEMWPGNYTGSNAIGIPNASATYFDFGDGGASSSTGHGCMQVHNHGAQQTVWALNHFNNNGVPGIGIGNENAPGTGHTDYTFTYNAATYTRRILHILVLPGAPEDNAAPTLTGASASRSLNKLTVSFSEALSDSAATDGSFTLNNGVTVIGAALNPDKLSIVLTTSPMTAQQSYTLTVSGVCDRTANGNLIIPNSTIGFTTPSNALPEVLTNVPEIEDYTLIHQLAIGNTVNYHPAGANYSVDESLYVQTTPFDRIAYCMELTGTNGFAQWVYVSADAFTADISKIGVPTLDRDTIWQQYINNLNVYASANIAGSTITTGTGISTGNIEFWPSNYQEANALGIPGASSSTFDFGDMRSAGDYGSMQLHSTGAAQTIFAFNNWGANGRTPGLGIGTQPTGSPDWTHNSNATTYSQKNLYVLVRQGGTDESTGNGPEIFIQPQPATVIAGSAAHLHVYAPGATGYQWRKNGIWIAGATQATLTFTPSALADNASYDVLVISDAGSTLSEAASLTVTLNGTVIVVR